MLQLNFNAISEPKPGEKWKKLFHTHWPAYKAWFESKGAVHKPGLETAQVEFRHHMPELLSTYERLCELAGNDPIAARFLTGYQPPAYISGCSQAILESPPQLVRNYDYHPALSEGTLLNTAWNDKHVMGVGDCLWGVVDGMNTDGLVASLTFGGRKAVGKGFGIPFILRYVLEAVEVLKRVPTHMSYNIMVLDKTGAYKLLQLSPDRKPVVTDQRVSTNHQGAIDWPEHAQFSKTVAREQHLLDILKVTDQAAEFIAKSFLKKPLFNWQYNDGFGTLYTSVYHPAEGRMELRWLDHKMEQSFADFQERSVLITYTQKAPSFKEHARQHAIPAPAAEADYWIEYGKQWNHGKPSELGLQVMKQIGGALGMAGTAGLDKILEAFISETKRRGQVPWEMLADVWAGLGNTYWEE